MVDVDIEEVGQVAPGTPLPPWSVRIPAAIKKAEGLIGPDDWYANDASTVVVTAGELALAKDACETWELETMKLYGGIAQEPPPELIAFTEKIEKLT